MPTNEYLQYATDVGANVESQADYTADSARTAGAAVGATASSSLANKAWRQACFMASMIGQFIVDVGAVDALDNANLATLKNNFITAINALIDAAIAGLGTASGKDATDGSQPDVASVIAPVTPGNIAVFADADGTIEDGGPAPLGGSKFVSMQYAWAANASIGPQAHGLGAAPDFVVLKLICLVGERGYSAGDIVMENFSYAGGSGGSGNHSGWTVWWNATDVGATVADNGIWTVDKGTGLNQQLTPANWHIVLAAFLFT